MKQFYTYLHCKPNGDPFYVGKGKGNRAMEFAGRNAHHRNVVEKYGRDKIDVFIFPRTSEQDAFDTEIRWISQFNREGLNLANKTDGGEGSSGCIPSLETRAKISFGGKGIKHPKTPAHVANHAASLRGKKHTAEHKAKISESSKRCKPNLGKKASLETRAKISAASKIMNANSDHRKRVSLALTGRIVTDATRAKIGLKHKGKVISEEQKAHQSKVMTGRKAADATRSKISASLIGNSHTLGCKLSDEHKAKIGAASKAMWAARKICHT